MCGCISALRYDGDWGMNGKFPWHNYMLLVKPAIRTGTGFTNGPDSHFYPHL